jgi:alanine-synthesizing transaminase
MFSSRLAWRLTRNPIARLLAEKRAAGETILDLTESNPTRAGIAYPAAEISRALADPRALAYDPDPAGLPDAREAVSAYYRERGCDAAPERILLTASTSEAYAYLFKLLADPGDEILSPRPSYPLFEYLAALESVSIVQYPLFYDHGWHMDLAALRDRITERTRAIVLVNPNNPTGSYLKRHELDALLAIASGRGLALISDEVFGDYTFTEDPSRVGTLAGLTEALEFSLSGLSKIGGLPQMKLGWIAMAGEPQRRRDAWERLELIADTYLSVGTPVQVAFPSLLALGAGVQAQIQARTRANLAHLRSALPANAASTLLDVEGGWYATLQVPRTRTEQEWVLDLLRSANVLVQPGFFYDFESEAYLVLSLLTESAAFREGVRRLLAIAL